MHAMLHDTNVMMTCTVIRALHTWTHTHTHTNIILLLARAPVSIQSMLARLELLYQYSVSLPVHLILG